MISLLLGVLLAQVPDAARTATKMELVTDPPPKAFCEPDRSPLLSVEKLCAAKPTSIRSEQWRLPKKDDTWTVRVDELQFSSKERATEQFERLRELIGHVAGERADGRKMPSLSWCEASYLLSGESIVMASVACGASRPWCAVTSALLHASGPGGVAIVGRIGGSAQLVHTPADVCPATKK